MTILGPGDSESATQEYPDVAFYSLDSYIADVVITAITSHIWETYRPIDVSKKKWLRIGAKIKLALGPSSFHYPPNDCTPDEFDEGWRLLGKWLPALWN